MKKSEQPFETREHDLSGKASVDLNEDFSQFAAKLAGYNPDRFDPVAMKVFLEKENLIVTVFALDKYKQDQSNYPQDKLPVKKFKMEMSWSEFVSHIKGFDFIVSDGAFDIQDMLVENK